MIGWTFYPWLSLLITTMHSSIKQTPFFYSCGHHPQKDPSQIKDVGSLAAEDLVAHLVAVHDEFAFQLYEAYDYYKDYADRNWKIHSNFYTLGIKRGFYNKIYKQKDHQESLIIKDWVYSKLLRK
jgi:hypothetical protein